MSHNYLSRGEYNVTCDRCGRKLKSSQVSKEWTGLIVCSQCLDERHPQDFVRGVRDHMAVPVARPYPPLAFTASPLPPSLSVYGTLVTPLNSGREAVWDYANTPVVTLQAGSIASVQEADVLNGANVAAVESASGVWELIQFQNAVNTTGSTYIISKLLRAHLGTEMNMGNPTPAGARFVYIGQSGISTYQQILDAFNIGNIPFSPINITAHINYSDLVINWVRRSKIPRIDQNDYDPGIGDPLGELYEKYGVDILDSSGNVVRTIYVNNNTQAVYGYFNQIADFGSVQPSYTVRIYQISPDYGNGTYRQATITLSTLKVFYSLYNESGVPLINENAVSLSGM